MGFLDNFTDFVTSQGREDKRKREVAALAPKLIELGLTPEETNEVAGNYVKTGNLTLPTTRETETRQEVGPKLSFDMPGANGTRSVTQFPETQVDTQPQPVRLGKPTSMDQTLAEEVSSGRMTVPEAMQLKFKQENTEEQNGLPAYIDNAGKLHPVDMGNVPRGTKLHMVTRPKDEVDENAKREAEYQRRAAFDVLQKFHQKQTLQGRPNVPELTADDYMEAADAAKAIGMPTKQVGFGSIPWWQQVQNLWLSKDKQNQPPNIEGPAFDANGKQNPGQGKPLTIEKAAEFMRAAGGDKNKARVLARQAGYSF